MADDIIRFTSPDPAQGPPIPFELDVVHLVPDKVTEPPEGWHDEHPGEEFEPYETERQERRVHLFHAVPDLSGGVLVQIDLMIASNRPGSAGGQHVRGGDALFDFLEALVVPEERAEFMGLIHDKKTYVHSQTLTDIALHFYRRFSGRPTKSPAS